MLDIAIRGGTVTDGSGRAGFKADVGISEGKIVEIRSVSSPADVIIDATNKVVAPGFIDVHSHSDLSLLVDPSAQSKLRQGVTTEVNGNCGFGVAPIPREDLSEFINFWRSSGSEWFDVRPTWESFEEYLGVLESVRPAINTSILAAHGSIRFVVMKDAPRGASDEEIGRMEEIVEDCMKSGACGLSSGLRYTPSCYADVPELVGLCRVVKKYGGLYATHMRSEGDNGSWEGAVNEAVSVAREAGVPLQISHLKALSKNVWNTSEHILKLCDSLRREGMELTADQYPYDAAHTGLTVFLPKSITMEELKILDQDRRAKVLDHVKRVLQLRGGPDRIVILSSPGHRYDGKDISQVASELKIPSAEETILKLIVESGGEVSIISRSMTEDDIRRIMKKEYVMVSTDGYSIAPEGPSAVGIPHPRSYGTYPRVLGRYSRDLNVITLVDAVRKMSGLPSKTFRLKGRGILAEGTWADVVVFDPTTIIDCSTFSSPAEYPAGIDFVLVNGKVATDNVGGQPGERAGRVLRLRNGSAA